MALAERLGGSSPASPRHEAVLGEERAQRLEDEQRLARAGRRRGVRRDDVVWGRRRAHARALTASGSHDAAAGGATLPR